jgi:flagellar protein FlaG
MLNENDITESLIGRAIKEANQVLAPSNFRLSYAVHSDTNKVMVRVYDSDTQEVIREIPPESRLDSMARILEFAGLIFDRRS